MASAVPEDSTVVEDILTHSRPVYSFTFSPFLLQTYRLGLPPDRPICGAYLTGHCPNGTACLDRHVSDAKSSTGGRSHGGGYYNGGGPNSLVCKHWLRGLCKKGEQCEFLHEYNLRKMPECNFFIRNGFCSNGDECLYLHVDPRNRLPPCPAYERGFCPLGPACSKKHVRRRICLYYLAGFCPDGPACRLGTHPKWRTESELKEEEEAAAQKVAAIEKLQAESLGDETAMGRRDDSREKDREGQRDWGTRDRDRDRDDGDPRFGRGGKWRGKTERKFRGRGY